MLMRVSTGAPRVMSVLLRPTPHSTRAAPTSVTKLSRMSRTIPIEAKTPLDRNIAARANTRAAREPGRFSTCANRPESSASDNMISASHAPTHIERVAA